MTLLAGHWILILFHNSVLYYYFFLTIDFVLKNLNAAETWLWVSCVSPEQINANPQNSENCTENVAPWNASFEFWSIRKAQEMHCFVISFHKCNLKCGITTSSFSSWKLCSTCNSFSTWRKYVGKNPEHCLSAGCVQGSFALVGGTRHG